MVSRRLSHLVGEQVAEQLDVPSQLYKHRKAILRCIFACVFYILVSVYYNQVEGWDVLDCVYYITVTITTVGYGDFHPTTDVSLHCLHELLDYQCCRMREFSLCS